LIWPDDSQPVATPVVRRVGVALVILCGVAAGWAGAAFGLKTLQLFSQFFGVPDLVTND
jgi:hypothetical protein